MSQYGITRYSAWYRGATISLGVAGAALAVGIRTVLGAASSAVVVLLGLFALARLIISWFPMDNPDGQRTRSGQLHWLIAFVTFTSITIAAIRLGALLGTSVRWHDFAPVSTVFGWAMVACLAVMFLVRFGSRLRGHFGLVERAFYVLMVGWVLVFAFVCLRGTNDVFAGDSFGSEDLAGIQSGATMDTEDLAGIQSPITDPSSFPSAQPASDPAVGDGPATTTSSASGPGMTTGTTAGATAGATADTTATPTDVTTTSTGPAQPDPETSG